MGGQCHATDLEADSLCAGGNLLPGETAQQYENRHPTGAHGALVHVAGQAPPWAPQQLMTPIGRIYNNSFPDMYLWPLRSTYNGTTYINSDSGVQLCDVNGLTEVSQWPDAGPPNYQLHPQIQQDENPATPGTNPAPLYYYTTLATVLQHCMHWATQRGKRWF